MVDDFYRIRVAADPAISPNGATVAYVLAAVEREGYRYHRSIWTLDVAGGEATRLTDGNHDSGPLFSPDGRWIAFTRSPPAGTRAASQEEAARGVSHPQLWVIPATGGEARQLTALPRGASSPAWAPDSRSLLVTSETGQPDDPEAAAAVVSGNDVPYVRTIDTMLYRWDGRGWIYEWRSHVFRVELDAQLTQLTDGDHNDADPAWSPDGRRVAFVSDRSEERWSWPGGDVWILDIASGALERITDESLSCGRPTWTTDGTTLGFPAATKRHSAGHVDVFVAEARGGADVRSLTINFKPVCSDVCIDDQRAFHEGAGTLEWRDGLGFLFLASGEGTTQLYRADPAQQGPVAVTRGDHHVYAVGLDAAGGTGVVAISDARRPGDLELVSLADGVTRPLVELNQWLGAEVDVRPLEQIQVRSSDGQRIQAWVMRPATTDGRPVPAVLEVHGGPAAMYGHSFNMEFQLLAAEGHAVVHCNPRGSTGYGREFSAAVQRDWGGIDTVDILAALDAALALGGIDAGRLGVAGGSYGGYMTNWLIGHSDRFKAAVSMRSVANEETMFSQSDAGWLLTVDEMGTTPWEGHALLRERSPIAYVENIHTPLLLLHSEEDLRCPIGEAEQMFTALKYLGREVRLVRFEGQSHELSRSGHPRSRTIRLQLILDWFREHLAPAGGS